MAAGHISCGRRPTTTLDLSGKYMENPWRAVLNACWAISVSLTLKPRLAKTSYNGGQAAINESLFTSLAFATPFKPSKNSSKT
jgi:hypothetical protein